MTYTEKIAAEYADLQRQIGQTEGSLHVANMWMDAEKRRGTHDNKNNTTTQPKPRNTTAKQYNLMRVMQGLSPITTHDDDIQPNTEGLRYYSGSIDKDASEKVRKSFALMALFSK
jgi:hypothetical protein